MIIKEYHEKNVSAIFLHRISLNLWFKCYYPIAPIIHELTVWWLSGTGDGDAKKEAMFL